jgi:hypothetical protein
MPVTVWFSNGAAVKVEKAVAATFEPPRFGSGVTQGWLISRDAHGHEVAKFRWADVVGYHVTKPEEKSKRD